MVTLESVDLWSETEEAVVPFDVALEEETDEGGNVAKVILVKRGEEIHRFSPNSTDEEILAAVAEMNGGHE